jgi:hypothetical protein
VETLRLSAKFVALGQFGDEKPQTRGEPGDQLARRGEAERSLLGGYTSCMCESRKTFSVAGMGRCACLQCPAPACGPALLMN